MALSVRRTLTWWRDLPQNPIYQREKGRWGNPNPFYDTLSRYSVLIILGTILIGACTGFTSPLLYGASDAMSALYCFLCLPGLLVNIVVLYALFTAPALTAPLISIERDRGTWETLRTTPQSTRSIVMAKLFGALSRQRIWPILIGLTLLQGAALGCSYGLFQSQFAWLGIFVGGAAALRPLLEVFFAALCGLVASLWLRSATSALVFSYSAVLALKLLNSSAAWAIISELLPQTSLPLLMTTAVPVIIYTLIIAILLLVMRWRLNEQMTG